MRADGMTLDTSGYNALLAGLRPDSCRKEAGNRTYGIPYASDGIF